MGYVSKYTADLSFQHLPAMIPTALVFDCDPEMTLFRLILYAQALILALHVCCYSKQQAARVFIRSTACKNSHINTV